MKFIWRKIVHFDHRDDEFSISSYPPSEGKGEVKIIKFFIIFTWNDWLMSRDNSVFLEKQSAIGVETAVLASRAVHKRGAAYLL
jgi:hypothetical protein